MFGNFTGVVSPRAQPAALNKAFAIWTFVIPKMLCQLYFLLIILFIEMSASLSASSSTPLRHLCQHPAG